MAITDANIPVTENIIALFIICLIDDSYNIV
jgi:hypothetical protein